MPSHASAAFNEAMKDALPHLFEADPMLMHKLVTMLSPQELKARGIPVYRLVLCGVLVCVLCTGERVGGPGLAAAQSYSMHSCCCMVQLCVPWSYVCLGALGWLCTGGGHAWQQHSPRAGQLTPAVLDGVCANFLSFSTVFCTSALATT